VRDRRSAAESKWDAIGLATGIIASCWHRLMMDLRINPHWIVTGASICLDIERRGTVVLGNREIDDSFSLSGVSIRLKCPDPIEVSYRFPIANPSVGRGCRVYIRLNTE
jgi:hypothetical protein